MAKRWERSDAVIAQRISTSQVGRFPSRKIKLSDGESAITERDGDPVATFSTGTHKVGGLISSPASDIVFVDRKPKTVRREVKGLWSKDDKEVNAAVEMGFMVSDPEKVRRLLMGRRDLLTIEDVWEELRKEVVSSVLSPLVKGKGVDALQGERKTENEAQVAAEVEMKKKLEVYGIDLVSFSVEFILPGEYQEYLRRRGEAKESSEMERLAEEDETRKAVHDVEVAEIDGTKDTRDGAMDDMENERIRREAEMAIEDEETQQDMLDAMEALKLKELKDREKSLRDTDREELGLEALKERLPKSMGESAEEKYESLKSVIGATEKKFLERKIDKKMFRKLMQDYEKEKIGLEVEMKKKK